MIDLEVLQKEIEEKSGLKVGLRHKVIYQEKTIAE